jgi:flagellum-specific peptidoglycan hydrolase FlgJ
MNMKKLSDVSVPVIIVLALMSILALTFFHSEEDVVVVDNYRILIEKDNAEYRQQLNNLNNEVRLLKDSIKNCISAKDTVEDVSRDMTQKIKFVSSRFPKDIKELAHIAENERVKFGIPVSITFAQAFLESGIRYNEPASKLATEDKNYFGIKWKGVSPYQNKLIKAGLKIESTVERCNKDEKDCAYYIKFESRWDCFRAKSIMITGGRYRRLQGKPFAEFARGLKKGGYATDPRYAEKLIDIIIRYRLYELD